MSVYKAGSDALGALARDTLRGRLTLAWRGAERDVVPGRPLKEAVARNECTLSGHRESCL